MKSILNTNKGGRVIGYLRRVSLLAETKINNVKNYSYSPNLGMQFALKDIKKNPSEFYKQLNIIHTDSSIRLAGSEVHGTDVFFHNLYTTNFVKSNKDLSPEQYFYANGKYPPKLLDLNTPDVTKPATSITEVLTLGFVSSNWKNSKIEQSIQKVNIKSPFNFSRQARPDCKLEVLLNDGNIFTCWIDSKSMNLNVLKKYLYSMANYKNGDKLKCNFYFVGGLNRNHVFSFKETNGIFNVIKDSCVELLNSNDPVAVSFVNENLPMINKFASTGSILDLQKSQIGPYIFSQPHIGTWFSSLKDYP